MRQVGLPWIVLALLAGCAGDDEVFQLTEPAGPGAPLRPDVAPDAGADAPADDADLAEEADGGPVRIAETEAASRREACDFGPGAMGWETVGAEFPVGDDIPIDHFILLMQENRSFDHYFGAMPGVDGHPSGASNPTSGGDPVEPFHETLLCTTDVAHSWNASHQQFNGGANDGFVITNDPGGERAMGYYDAADLPFYYDLYRTFAMSDRHFCSVLGPTWVNRLYFMAGTSFGLVRNGAPAPERAPEDEVLTVFQLLDAGGRDWRVYFEEVPFLLRVFPGYAVSRAANTRDIALFFEDVAAGDLPAVTWIDPSFSGGAGRTDEHPPGVMQLGQRWVADIVEAVMTSPLWERTAIILTYDEHGGYYDHVPPPEACVPGDFAPDLLEGDEPGDFDRLGFRVPLVVASPYSRPGYVSHRVTDLTSVLRLIEVRFDLPALTGRDANAWPLLDLFDFASPALADPPDLDAAVVDEAAVAACQVLFPAD